MIVLSVKEIFEKGVLELEIDQNINLPPWIYMLDTWLADVSSAQFHVAINQVCATVAYGKQISNLNRNTYGLNSYPRKFPK